MFYPILFSIAGFLSGGVLYSYHVPKLLCGVDVVADSPDHNPGMTNAMKLCGVPVGLLCLALDMAKGFLPVFAALRFLRIEDPWLAPVLAAPALGHALAVFYPFAGGKAVAVSFGVLLGLLPQSAAQSFGGEGLAVCRIEGGAIRTTVTAVRRARAESSPAAQAFWSFLEGLAAPEAARAKDEAPAQENAPARQP